MPPKYSEEPAEAYRPWYTDPRTGRWTALTDKPVGWDEAWRILRQKSHEMMAAGVEESVINESAVLALRTDAPSVAYLRQYKRNQMLTAHFEGGAAWESDVDAQPAPDSGY